MLKPSSAHFNSEIFHVISLFVFFVDSLLHTYRVQAAALRLLQSMAMVTGVSPLIHWLQGFRYDPQQAKLNDPDYVPPVSGAVGVSPSTSLVMTVGERCFL